MSWYMIDPQTEKGHFCEICGCEHFEDGEICQKCERMLEEYDD